MTNNKKWIYAKLGNRTFNSYAIFPLNSDGMAVGHIGNIDREEDAIAIVEMNNNYAEALNNLRLLVAACVNYRFISGNEGHAFSDSSLDDAKNFLEMVEVKK